MHDEAIDAYHEAVRSDPSLLPARYMLSAALRKRGRHPGCPASAVGNHQAGAAIRRGSLQPRGAAVQGGQGGGGAGQPAAGQPHRTGEPSDTRGNGNRARRAGRQRRRGLRPSQGCQAAAPEPRCALQPRSRSRRAPVDRGRDRLLPLRAGSGAVLPRRPKGSRRRPAARAAIWKQPRRNSPGRWKSFPETPMRANTLGAALLRLRDFDAERFATLRRRFRRTPLLVKAHRNLAQAYQRAGRPEDARAASERSEAAAAHPVRRRTVDAARAKGKAPARDRGCGRGGRVLPRGHRDQLRIGGRAPLPRRRSLGCRRRSGLGAEVIGRSPPHQPAKGGSALTAEVWRSRRPDGRMKPPLHSGPAWGSLLAWSRRSAHWRGSPFQRGDLDSARPALSAVLAWHPEDREALAMLARVRRSLAE